MTQGKKFRKFPLIYINPKKAWGNPTVGDTRLPVFKVWEMVSDSSMDDLLEEEPSLTLGEVNMVMEFVDWGIECGLMKVKKNGMLSYDKDALYRAAHLRESPSGALCVFCTGFISKGSPAWLELNYKEQAGKRFEDGVCHPDCLQAVMMDESPPETNVLR